MGDFRRLVELQLEEFRDAIVAEHAREIDVLRGEIQKLKQALARRADPRDPKCDKVPEVVLPQQGRPKSEGIPEHAPRESAMINADPPAVMEFEAALEDNTCETKVSPLADDLELDQIALNVRNTMNKAKERAERYAVKDFWVSKFVLLQVSPFRVRHRSRYPAKLGVAVRALRTTSSRPPRDSANIREPCIVDPDSAQCMLWGWIGLLFLLYDFLYIPVDVAFDPPEETWSVVATWTARVYWSLDIIMSFITGIRVSGTKEMRLKQIAYRYSRTWLPFDLTIVGVDWIMYFVVTGSEQRSFTLLRSFRFVRLVRLLRLGKLKRTASDMADRLSSELPGCMSAMTETIFITSYWAIFMHFLSCMSFAVARFSDVSLGAVPPAADTVAYNYLSSMHLTLTLQHAPNETQTDQTAERAFACAATFVTLLVYSFLFARTTYALFGAKDSTTAKLVAMSWQLTTNRKLSRDVAGRIHQYLRAQHAEGIGDRLMNERILMARLPETLQIDINSEIRTPTLTLLQFFLDMETYNARAMRKICTSAMSELLVLERDSVFAPGEGCSRMLFVTQGSFMYLPGKREQIPWTRSLPPTTKPPKSASDVQFTEIQENMYLCEPALWTTWEHKGDLTADTDSLLVELSAEKFEAAIRHNNSASVHALMYARHFVWYLNHAQDSVDSDVIDICLPIETLEGELFTGSEQDHFVFISHYKKESGTEAAMMALDLERMIRDDVNNAASEFRFPVFIDSENLRDLAELTAHVRRSRYLFFLLTPGVLSRPWCLVELVHAMRQGVEVLPILINRPGISFDFPTEAYYDSILAAEVLNQETLELLATEGIDLPDLVGCMRKMFRKIALNFSPHRTANIRQAELAEIIDACRPIHWDELAAPACSS